MAGLAEAAGAAAQAAVAIAVAYQLTALWASIRFRLRREPASAFAPPVSILKPVCGLDPGFEAALRAHATQEYPTFEILFGIADPADPAAAAIRRVSEEFPGANIRLIHCTTRQPNAKAGVLIGLAREARHPLLLVSDSDIHPPAGYLRGVVAPLAEDGAGLVTCLYRGRAETWAGRFEALGIATDFAPSTLVAPLVGVREFGLGSTLVFRRADLEAIGGFAAVAEYLADDYQLAKRLTRGLGKRAHLSTVIVDTSLQAATWTEVWRHQVRWHRTIRVSRWGGYLGLPVTFATLWACAALLTGQFWLGLACLAVRMLTAAAGGALALRCAVARRLLWLVPVRDLFGVAVWAVALFGDRVQWRDRSLRITPDGRIQASEP